MALSADYLSDINSDVFTHLNHNCVGRTAEGILIDFIIFRHDMYGCNVK